MKFATIITACASLLATGAYAASTNNRQVLITYPDSVPDQIMNEAKNAIRAAGGMITHEFDLIRGFSASLSEKMLDAVSALSADFKPIIEDNGPVHIAGSDKKH